MRQFNSITYSMDMNMTKLWEIAEGRGAWHAAVAAVYGVTVRHDLSTEQQQQITYMWNLKKT